MTDFAIRLPQTQSPAAVAETPIRWRMRGAAMAAAVVLGTAGSTAVIRSADHGVAVAPALGAAPALGTAPAFGTAAALGTASASRTAAGFGSPTAAAGPAGIVAASAAPLRAFAYDSATGSLREIA
ncbi:hypothetical protein AB0C07_38810 [Actinoplanes missouriensis]|uniref:hypothetical protein n=1 Tax=Actinoplanes missouriensis TaxID=1866 RepID=UPI0033DDAAC8